MDDHDLVMTLARIAEGAVLALKNRGNRPEMVANLEYAHMNLRHVLQTFSPESLR